MTKDFGRSGRFGLSKRQKLAQRELRMNEILEVEKMLKGDNDNDSNKQKHKNNRTTTNTNQY